ERTGAAQQVNASLREEPAAAALREASASTGVSRFRAPTSLGRFRRLADGRYVGFVVHAATLGAWVDGRGPALAPDVHAAVSVGAPRDETPARAGVDRPLGAMVQVAP